MSEKPRLSTRSEHETVLAITMEMVRQQTTRAKSNSRGREILMFHECDRDSLHRMLNAIEPGSYIRPHRHATPPKAEGIVVLSGALGFVTFSDDGVPNEDSFFLLGADREAIGLDFRAGIWHTFFALEAGTVVYEVKPGPYDPGADKEFADWAPDEHTPEAGEYLARLVQRFARARSADL